MKSVSHRTATASLWTIGGKFFARIFDFVSLVILARLLSPDDFGLVAIGTSILVIIEAVLDLPLTQALLREPSPSADMFDTALTLSLIRGASISLVMLAAAWPMGLIYHDPRLFSLVAVLSIAPAARSLISPRMVSFMQAFDFRREFSLDIISKTSSLLFAVGTAYTTGSYWGLAIGAVAGPTIAMLVSYVYAPMRPTFCLLEWKYFQDMVGWNTLSQCLDSVNWQLDRLLLPRFTTLASFGAFSVADNLAGIPHQTFVGPLMRPLIAAFSGVADEDKLRSAYVKATTAITLVAAPILIILAFLAKPVIEIIVGAKWAVAAPILEWLCIVSLIGLPTTMMPALALAVNRTRFVALRMFVEFIFRFPTTVIGVFYFGLPGAIAARVIAAVAAYAACLFVVRHLIGLRFSAHLTAFLRPMIATIPIIALLLAVEPTLSNLPLGVSQVLGLIIVTGGSLVAFWGTTFLIWFLIGKPDGLESMILQKLSASRGRGLAIL